MDKHLLVAVSEHRESSAGVRFACSLFNGSAGVRMTLLHVLGTAGQDAAAAAAMQRRAADMLHGVRQWAEGQGVLPADIETLVLPRRYGVLRDIVDTARKGLYDAVVVGGRYLSRLEQMYEDSVSRGLLWESVDFPVWICHQPDASRRNMLLCLDGEEPSYRIADHAGFMLRDCAGHAFTLLHFNRARTAAEEVLERGRMLLEENGVGKDRIETLVMESSDHVESILNVADRGHYAVVAAGRNKRQPDSFFNRLFTRSVTMRLRDNTQRFALWVSQ